MLTKARLERAQRLMGSVLEAEPDNREPRYALVVTRRHQRQWAAVPDMLQRDRPVRRMPLSCRADSAG